MQEDFKWNKSEFTCPEKDKLNRTLVQELDRVCLVSPQATAIIWNQIHYSYNALKIRVAEITSEINQYPIKNGPIALILPIGLDYVASWFACSAAGRPFLLLDPDFPKNRLQELISQSRCSVILTNEKLKQLSSTISEIPILVLGANKGSANLNKQLNSDELAIIFPTSGSEGKPKLIAYSSKTILAKVISSIELMKINYNSRVLIASNHANFGFLHHALVFLLSGNSISLLDIKSVSANSILNQIIENKINNLRLTPSLFRQLACLPLNRKAFEKITAIRFSGEPFQINDLKIAHTLFNENCLIQNVYGSTESALFIWSVFNSEHLLDFSVVPIGNIYPFASYAIIPDNESNVDNPSVGELVICSEYNALGDVENGTINSSRFPSNSKNKKETIFHTGDIVQQLPNGHLVHLGRKDRMIKIRGYKVFLSEIENSIRSIPGIIECAVFSSNQDGFNVINSFVTTDNKALTSEIIIEKLRQVLPDYMLPRNLEIKNQLPMLPSGKIDYYFMKESISIKEKSENISDVEKLFQIWDSIFWDGAHKEDKDFLALGGDSFSFMILIAEIENKLEKNIPIESFRHNSTITHLAHLLNISIPNENDAPKRKLGIHAFQLGEKRNNSKGNVLIMPGYSGWSPSFPVIQSGLFEDYDLWSLEVHTEFGALNQPKQFWKIVFEIVHKIKMGELPKPIILFGFSFGGGLAWIIGRLLTGSPYCPEHIIMVDAPPLHRLKKYNKKKTLKALYLNITGTCPNTLHIRRAPIESISFLRNENNWKSNDHVNMTIDIPTIDHVEMNRSDVLAIAKKCVNQFLNKNYNSCTKLDIPPNLTGVELYYAITKNQKSTLNSFVKNPKSLNIDQMMILFYNSLSINEINTARVILNHALLQWPENNLIRFIQKRMNRNPQLLIDCSPYFLPIAYSSVDKLIIKSNSKKPLQIIRPLSLIFLLFDIFNTFSIKHILKLRILKK